MSVLRHLNWLHAHGRMMDRRLRRELLERLRPPSWLPCWFFGLWFRAAAWWVRVPVIAELACGTDLAAIQRFVGRGRRGCRHLRSITGVSGRIRAGKLAGLCGCAGVARVWYDGEVRLLDPVSAEPADLPPGGPPALPAVGADKVHAAGYTGAGVTIAVVDTGIHPHDDFTRPAPRIKAFVDLVRNRAEPYDDNGHGTHVAGCAAGSGSRSGGAIRGTAPSAGIVAVKALNRAGTGQLSTIIAAIDWVVEHAEPLGIRILSLSLGGIPAGGYREDPLARAAQRAWKHGLVVVAAAGNDGPDAGTIASPGIHPRVITVGAGDDRGTPDPADDTVAGFSSRGPTGDGLIKPDVVAPGVNIPAARAPHSLLDKMNAGAREGEYYLRLSGTSMATPLVAGLVACLLQRFPHFTNDWVREAVTGSTRDLGEPPNSQGMGLIDGVSLVLKGNAE